MYHQFSNNFLGSKGWGNSYEDLRHIAMSATLKCEKEKCDLESRKHVPVFSLWCLCQAPFPPFIQGPDAQFCSRLSRLCKKLFQFHLVSELGEEIRSSY